MNFSLVYLLRAALRSIVDFLSHWYVDGSRAIRDRYRDALYSIDNSLAPKITLQHLFEPLYRDYSIVGRIIGPFFRLWRALLGFGAVAVVSILYAILYIFWIAVPLIIIAYATGLRR